MAVAPSSPAPAPTAGDRSWYIVERWQEYEGEARANLLRLLGIAAFYLVELGNYYGLSLGSFTMPAVRSREFHLGVTALAIAWAMVALGVQLCLRNRIFPAGLKYLSTAADLALLTGLLCLAEGPRSPAVLAYFVILALAAMRWSVLLMQSATAGALVSYLAVIARAEWLERNVVPHDREALMLLCLGLTGGALIHVVHRARGMAEDYAQRLAARTAATSEGRS